MGNKLGKDEGVALKHAPSCNGFIEKPFLRQAQDHKREAKADQSTTPYFMDEQEKDGRREILKYRPISQHSSDVSVPRIMTKGSFCSLSVLLND